MREITPGDLAEERWIPIPGWEGFYEISDQGRVRSVDRVVRSRKGIDRRIRGRVLRPSLTASGYRFVMLSRDSRPVPCYIHVSVLTAFVSPRPGRQEACHNNGVKTDNRLSNLRWDTRSENQIDRIRHGLHAQVNQVECLRGHVLAPPNLVPLRGRHRSCLACQRARTALRWRSERYGTAYTAEEMQMLSDAKYAEIMTLAA